MAEEKRKLTRREFLQVSVLATAGVALTAARQPTTPPVVAAPISEKEVKQPTTDTNVTQVRQPQVQSSNEIVQETVPEAVDLAKATEPEVIEPAIVATETGEIVPRVWIPIALNDYVAVPELASRKPDILRLNTTQELLDYVMNTYAQAGLSPNMLEDELRIALGTHLKRYEPNIDFIVAQSCFDQLDTLVAEHGLEGGAVKWLTDQVVASAQLNAIHNGVIVDRQPHIGRIIIVPDEVVPHWDRYDVGDSRSPYSGIGAFDTGNIVLPLPVGVHYLMCMPVNGVTEFDTPEHFLHQFADGTRRFIDTKITREMAGIIGEQVGDRVTPSIAQYSAMGHLGEHTFVATETGTVSGLALGDQEIFIRDFGASFGDIRWFASIVDVVRARAMAKQAYFVNADYGCAVSGWQAIPMHHPVDGSMSHPDRILPQSLNVNILDGSGQAMATSADLTFITRMDNPASRETVSGVVNNGHVVIDTNLLDQTECGADYWHAVFTLIASDRAIPLPLPRIVCSTIALATIPTGYRPDADITIHFTRTVDELSDILSQNTDNAWLINVRRDGQIPSVIMGEQTIATAQVGDLCFDWLLTADSRIINAIDGVDTTAKLSAVEACRIDIK